MQSDINGQVLSVTGRQAGASTIYDVAFSDGNTYSTFDNALAQKANGLAGQTVTARVEVVQKPKNGKTYTNFNLLDVGAQGTLGPLAQPAAPGAPIAPAPAPIPVQQGGKMDPSREIKIVKQNVLGTAHDFVGQLFQGAGPEAFEQAAQLARDYAKELFVLVMGGQPAAPVVPAEATPAAVAEAVNAAAGTEIVGVGDAPQEAAQQGDPIPW